MNVRPDLTKAPAQLFNRELSWLAFNRRALDTLAQSLPPGGNSRGMLEQVASRRSAAESRLGRVKLPGERD